MHNMQKIHKAKTAAIIVLLAVAILLAGCGSEENNAPTTSLPPQTESKSNPVGPALSDKFTFSQLTLDSPVTRKVNEKGIAYLHFTYTDIDGKVYKVVMPEAMAEGAYPIQEWQRTFRIYRLPQVIKQKKIVKKDGSEGIADFPFISPRSMKTTQQGQPDRNPVQNQGEETPQNPSAPNQQGGPEYIPPGR